MTPRGAAGRDGFQDLSTGPAFLPLRPRGPAVGPVADADRSCREPGVTGSPPVTPGSLTPSDDLTGGQFAFTRSCAGTVTVRLPGLPPSTIFRRALLLSRFVSFRRFSGLASTWM